MRANKSSDKEVTAVEKNSADKSKIKINGGPYCDCRKQNCVR